MNEREDHQEPNEVTIRVEASHTLPLTVSLSLSVKSQLSHHLLWSASHFSQLTKHIELENRLTAWQDIPEGARYEHRSYVISGILASTTFLESTINDLYAEARDTPNRLTPVLGEESTKWIGVLWSRERDRASSSIGSILEKYQLVLEATGKTPFQTNILPYQGQVM